MSDSSGFIYDEDGIGVEKLKYLMKIKNIDRERISKYAKKFPSSSYIKNKTPWTVGCDIALPCATQNELKLADAKNLIKNECICVGEGANMPTTPDAIKLLIEKKVLFAPGKASNAGGVAVSGLEMAQNSLRYNWSREEVDSKLKGIMNEIHKSCLEYGSDKNYTNYVKGANIAGFVKALMLDCPRCCITNDYFNKRIVLRKTKYSDSSLIVDIFTELEGRKSFS